MTNHVFNAVVNDFVRHRNRLFRVTGIVIFYDLQFVAFNAAFSVDIRNRLLCAGKLLVTTTATLISSARAILLNASAIHPASNALPFMFILRIPILLVITCVVMLLFSTLFRFMHDYPCFSSILC